jgi:hypothetical protein
MVCSIVQGSIKWISYANGLCSEWTFFFTVAPIQDLIVYIFDAVIYTIVCLLDR